jgi:hypothetical protein
MRIRILPFNFFADPDPDPTTHFSPDLDPPDPDPAFHFDADPDPTFHSDADADPEYPLQLHADPDPTTHFSLDLDPPDPDPAFHFDADPDPAFHFNANPDPASQNDADPCGSGSATLHLIMTSFFIMCTFCCPRIGARMTTLIGAATTTTTITTTTITTTTITNTAACLRPPAFPLLSPWTAIQTPTLICVTVIERWLIPAAAMVSISRPLS